MSEPPEPGLELRIGNVERERTVHQLQTALGEGRLDIAEFDERLAAVYAARTVGDLVPITADLPGTAPATAPAGAEAPPVGYIRQRDRQRNRPQRHDAGWLIWAWRAWATAVAVNLVIWLAVWLSSGDPPYFWPIWVAGPWGAVLLVNTLFSNARRSVR